MARPRLVKSQYPLPVGVADRLETVSPAANDARFALPNACASPNANTCPAAFTIREPLCDGDGSKWVTDVVCALPWFFTCPNGCTLPFDSTIQYPDGTVAGGSEGGGGGVPTVTFTVAVARLSKFTSIAWYMKLSTPWKPA